MAVIISKSLYLTVMFPQVKEENTAASDTRESHPREASRKNCLKTQCLRWQMLTCSVEMQHLYSKNYFLGIFFPIGFCHKVSEQSH